MLFVATYATFGTSRRGDGFYITTERLLIYVQSGVYEKTRAKPVLCARKFYLIKLKNTFSRTGFL